MSRIRKLYFFDKSKIKKMISFLNNGSEDAYINDVMFNPFCHLHYFIPLRFKFLPESYVLKDGKNVKGLVTVEPTRCPLKQMEIQKLLFEENCYFEAEELIQFVVSRYKAMGTASFIVRVSDNLPELVKLFVSKCGFSQISYEKLWKIKKADGDISEKLRIREFRNSDSAVTASIYNESLLPHIRPLLSADTREHRESLFRGLSYSTEYKYVVEDRKNSNILAVFSIQTTDNKNYVLDIINSSWVDIDLDSILAYAYKKIQKRNKNFVLYFRTKKYTHSGEQYEKDMFERKNECVQNQVVLTNSSAKIIKETENSGKFTVLNKLYVASGVNIGGVSNKRELANKL